MKLKWRMDYWPTLHVIGLLCGSVCFAASLLPSLVPRDPLIQDLLSGLCFSAGYGFGYVQLRLWLAIVVGFQIENGFAFRANVSSAKRVVVATNGD